MEDYGILTVWPNKSPEPMPDGAKGSAVAVHAARKAWLSFFRLDCYTPHHI
jgi:hypothetical protein